MKPILHVAIVSLLSAATAVGAPADPFLDYVSSQMAGVQWSDKTAVVGDFNGDGFADQAVVGYRPSRVILAVGIGPSATARPVQFLEFGIDPSSQDAICAVPAELFVHELSCDPLNDNNPLPGCGPSKFAKALTLSGGECDAIHLYWSHDAQRMLWWRL